ncbi:MAG TPA: hypothetical protein VIE40_03300 [Dehalococcoidia bacterium]|jgi:hypothetical protein
MNQVSDAEPTAAVPAAVDDDEFEDDDDFEDADAEPEAAPVQQVPAYIAIIRIVAVLGMGLCISFGLFIMLVGLKGVIVGIPILLLSIPCYYGMQLAERLVVRHEHEASTEDG